MYTKENPSALPSIWSGESQVTHILLLMKWRNGEKWWGKYGSILSSWDDMFCRIMYTHVLNPQSVRPPPRGYFNKDLCQIWDRLTLHCGSETLKINYYHQKKEEKEQEKKVRQFVLSQVCLQENFLCLLALTIFVVMKTRNEFSLHPRWEVREGGPV